MTPSPVRPGPVYLTVLVIATCGLVYELVAGALASYLLGDTVTQFSLVIGIYLTAMGAGSWLSKFIEKGVVAAGARSATGFRAYSFWTGGK